MSIIRAKGCIAEGALSSELTAAQRRTPGKGATQIPFRTDDWLALEHRHLGAPFPLRR